MIKKKTTKKTTKDENLPSLQSGLCLLESIWFKEIACLISSYKMENSLGLGTASP